MKIFSFHAGGGRGAAYNCREGFGPIVARNGDRVTIKCAETGDLVDVHHRNTQPEPTPEQIAEQCAAFREAWGELRLQRDELYTPAGVGFYDSANGVH